MVEATVTVLVSIEHTGHSVSMLTRFWKAALLTAIHIRCLFGHIGSSH
jgi:hypothetical protein